MSLSEEPAFSVLKDELVCGYRDISKESWAGFSGKHEVDGNAINTTNGAGPKNLQTFILASDGTVMTCLPGYWAPQDLVSEIEFASRLHDVHNNPKYGPAQRRLMFRSMHIAHIGEHSQAMTQRSHMQHFDQHYEAQNRLQYTDTIKDRQAAIALVNQGGSVPQDAFKTTDVIMHERMSRRPFLGYNEFDTPRFANYGKPEYDKNEDQRTVAGQVNKQQKKSKQLIGNVPTDQNPKKRMMKNLAIRGLHTGLRMGLSAIK